MCIICKHNDDPNPFLKSWCYNPQDSLKDGISLGGNRVDVKPGIDLHHIWGSIYNRIYWHPVTGQFLRSFIKILRESTTYGHNNSNWDVPSPVRHNLSVEVLKTLP